MPRRLALTFVLLLVPSVAPAQVGDANADRLAALQFVVNLQDPDTAAFRPTPKAPPGLRATSSAIRAIKYLGGELPKKDKVTAFVQKCYDPETGGFAEPGGKPDVPTTAIGVFAVTELGVPHEKFAKAMDYLKANAKTFEDVRLGVAAVEAWGVKDCPFDLGPWLTIAGEEAAKVSAAPLDSRPRALGSVAALYLRVGKPLPVPDRAAWIAGLKAGQQADGGWAKAGESVSDGDTTYRVMRSLMLLNERPDYPDRLRSYLGSCRNPDGGFGTKPGEPSSVGGTYYYAIITKWLADTGN